MSEVRISTTHTELPPCCVRIHPDDNKILLLGTYQLEDDGTRNGSIDIYRFEASSLTLLHRYPTSTSILDIKFDPFDSSNIVTAHSEGNIMCWTYNLDSTLELKSNLPITESTNLLTSIFFSPIKQGSLLITSTTSPTLIYDLNKQTFDILETSHSLECWTGNFGELGQLSNVVYTGGDDSKLIAHDLRSNSHIWSTTSRQHQAGVVSILSPTPHWNNSNPHHLWSGSYDDNLRIFDLRLLDKDSPSLIPGNIPKTIHEENLGGGVWRLIPSPNTNDNRVFSCNMYDGARIIIPTENDHFDVEKYFIGEHESMVYGGDWATKDNFIVTCSFYDKVVHTWEP